MKNTTELRKKLSRLYNEVNSGKKEVQTAKSLVSISNTILKAAKNEMEYHKHLGDDEEIEFLKTPKK
tara:strand:+ start:506 stop:706 length:201 start_codon:yes stop_codon:yes gene_type:complete